MITYKVVMTPEQENAARLDSINELVAFGVQQGYQADLINESINDALHKLADPIYMGM